MKKIMLLGLGKKDKFTDESARISAGKAAQKAKELATKEFSILQFSNLDEGLIEAMPEGVTLALYTFDKYKEEKEPSIKIEEFALLITSDSPKFHSVAAKASHVVEAVNCAGVIANI